MIDTTKALQERSRQQTAMTALMLKIKAEDRRHIAQETLCKKNEREALLEATRHLSKATTAEIQEALQEIERIKGKKIYQRTTLCRNHRHPKTGEHHPS